jgi:hypothetical protein
MCSLSRSTAACPKDCRETTAGTVHAVTHETAQRAMPSLSAKSTLLPVEAARQAMPSKELEPKLLESECVAELPELEKRPRRQ